MAETEYGAVGRELDRSFPPCSRVHPPVLSRPRLRGVRAVASWAFSPRAAPTVIGGPEVPTPLPRNLQRLWAAGGARPSPKEPQTVCTGQDRRPYAPSWGPGDPSILNPNQTKSAGVRTPVPRLGGACPFTSFFFEGNRFKAGGGGGTFERGEIDFQTFLAKLVCVGAARGPRVLPAAFTLSRLHFREPRHFPAFALPGRSLPKAFFFCLFDFCFLFVCRIAAPCPGSLRASAAAGRHSSSARAGRSTGAPRSLKPSHPAFAWTGKRERRGVNRGFTDSGSLQRSPFADSNPPELHPQRFCSIVALKEARSDFNP